MDDRDMHQKGLDIRKEGRHVEYTLDGKIVNASKLRRTIVQLDDQLPIYWLQLRRGGADITDEQLTQMRALASDIEAKLLVERDGAMVPDAAPAPAPAG